MGKDFIISFIKLMLYLLCKMQEKGKTVRKEEDKQNIFKSAALESGY